MNRKNQALIPEAENPATERSEGAWISIADLLEKGVKTGEPKLMSLDELAQNCEGYISDEIKNGLCRGQGTFMVWYLAKTYGDDFWARDRLRVTRSRRFWGYSGTDEAII